MSYGRVKSALDDVNHNLTSTAHELLTAELAGLRAIALESLRDQRAHLDSIHETEMATSRSEITQNFASRMETSEAKMVEMEAEVLRLRDRSNQPEVHISRLEGELAERVRAFHGLAPLARTHSNGATR